MAKRSVVVRVVEALQSRGRGPATLRRHRSGARGDSRVRRARHPASTRSGRDRL